MSDHFMATEEKSRRLAKEMGYKNTVDALRKAAEMQSALRVIRTWASVPEILNPQYVIELIDRTLEK